MVYFTLCSDYCSLIKSDDLHNVVLIGLNIQGVYKNKSVKLFNVALIYQ